MSTARHDHFHTTISSTIALLRTFSIAMLLLPISNTFADTQVVATPEKLHAAIQNAKPGDVIQLQVGRWENLSLKLSSNGTKEKPIRLEAKVPGEVTLGGQSSIQVDGDHWIIDGLLFANGFNGRVIMIRGSHNRLTNCAVMDYSPPKGHPHFKPYTPWIRLGGQHNRIDHCYLVDKTDVGSTITIGLKSKPSFHQIDHNLFGYRKRLGRNGADTIMIGHGHRKGDYPHKVTVEYNLFDRCSGESEIISSKTSGNIIRYNTFLNCGGEVNLRDGARTVVEGNYFLSTDKRVFTRGVRVSGTDHFIINNHFQDLDGRGKRAVIILKTGWFNERSWYKPVKNCTIAGNTFFLCNNPGIELGDSPDRSVQIFYPDGVNVVGNLFVSKRPVFSGYCTNLELERNVAFGTGLFPATQVPTGFRFLNPDMKRHEENGYVIYRPSSQSPVRNAGVELPELKKDIDGQERKSPPDAGCDEIAEGEKMNRPLTPGDVGPDWLRKHYKQPATTDRPHP